MRTLWIYILTALMLAVVPASVTWAQPEEDLTVPQRPPLGSKAAQLRLKFNMRREGRIGEGGSLAAALDHNRHQWEMLSPDQRDEFRRKALAFMQKNPDEQEKLLDRYEKLIQMSAERQQAYRRRARWLKKVVATLTPAQRERIGKMAPRDRARVLLQIRDRLVEQGQLELHPEPQPPATQPTVPNREE